MSRNKKPTKQRNINKLLEARGEINLATRTGMDKKPKHSRKQKHKGAGYE